MVPWEMMASTNMMAVKAMRLVGWWKQESQKWRALSLKINKVETKGMREGGEIYI